MGRSSVGSRSTPVLECISGMPSGSNPYDPQASSQGTTYFDILLAHLDRAVAFQATGSRFDSGREQYLKSFRFSLTYFLEAWQSWFIAPVLKTDGPERGPGVRIPQPPLKVEFLKSSSLFMNK